MSDDADNEAVQPEPIDGAPLGSWLSAAREARSLTAASVAESLRLDTAVVEQLEAEDFEAMGALVFMRGHLRAIATHLGLDGDEALRRLHARAGIAADAEPELIVSYNRPSQRNNWLPVIASLAGLSLVVVAAFLAWQLWPTSSAETEVSTTAATPTEAVATPDNEAADSGDRTNASSATDALIAARQNAARTASAPAASDSTTRAAVPPAASEATTASPADTAAPTRGLRLQFSEECWFEVRDANDQRIAYGTARAGTDRRITGTRPFRVIVGVADAVTITVDGDPYTIAPSDRRGRSARLLID
ncbi:MAG: RodZ domain-containing protein [Pseudomonadota bacterium]